MKFLVTLLALLTLFLSAQPCCKEGDSCARETKIACQDQQNESDDCGQCSPFYSCGACTGFVIEFAEIDLSFLRIENTRISGFYLGCISKGFHFLPLQPPRFV